MWNDNLAYEYSNIPNGYLNKYVMGIPWERNPAFIFSDNPSGYLEAFENVVEVVPIGDMKVKFLDDVWDFNSYFSRKNTTSYRINFGNFPKEFKEYAKFFVLHQIASEKKISTVNTRYCAVRTLLKNILKRVPYATLLSITTDDIISEVSSRNLKPATLANQYQSIHQFFKFLKYNYQMDISVNIDILWEAADKARKASRNIDSKRSNIPEEYFQKIRNVAIRIMRDHNAEFNMRATACMLIILCETGLRISDLLELTVDGLKKRTLRKTGHEVNFIHYSSSKPSKANQEMLEFDIFCTAICFEAYNTMLSIRQECEFAPLTECIYVLNKVTGSSNGFPVTEGRFIHYYNRIIVENLHEDCSHDWDGTIAPSNFYGDVVYIPMTSQYRVHICSHLYNVAHVSLTWIQRYMGHLSSNMLGYYVRPKDNYQEDVLSFGQVIRKIHDEHLTPLGGDGNGIEIAKRINDFLDANNCTVLTDVKEIEKMRGNM